MFVYVNMSVELDECNVVATWYYGATIDEPISYSENNKLSEGKQKRWYMHSYPHKEELSGHQI